MRSLATETDSTATTVEMEQREKNCNGENLFRFRFSDDEMKGTIAKQDSSSWQIETTGDVGVGEDLLQWRPP